jgi:hypothetical protein
MNNSFEHRPNTLFILIDDLGCRDLGCFGSTFYETPHLDRLMGQGMRFDRAYASCPVCSPTRASIMSGKYPARVGVTQWIGGHAEGKLKDVPYLHYLPLEEKSVASALREDPSEQNDLSDLEPERLARMANRLKAWQREIEAKIPEPNPDYERRIREPRIPNNACE